MQPENQLRLRVQVVPWLLLVPDGRHGYRWTNGRAVAGAGHWVAREAPDQVNAALDEFLDSL